MPELPEVEILVRHLHPLLQGKRVRVVQVLRPRVLRPTTPETLHTALHGAKFKAVRRRGKYLLFELQQRRQTPFVVLGHLGMTGRMYVLPREAPLPKHTAVVMELSSGKFVFEDTRYFGRLTLDLQPLKHLGPEPLEPQFTTDYFAEALGRSNQSIKVKLLDQRLVAGIGNIYASEALHYARIAPTKPARKLSHTEIRNLRNAIRTVLRVAIDGGSTVPLNFSGNGARDNLFYYGKAAEVAEHYEERLRVYDRLGKPCLRGCRAQIQRTIQAGRSTFYCPVCQAAGRRIR